MKDLLSSLKKTLSFPALPQGVVIAWWTAALLFIVSLFSQSFDSDLNFWKAWMGMLQGGGYGALEANYPPILLHWLGIGGVLFGLLGIDDVSYLLIKVWVEIPVWFAWMLLIYQVSQALENRGILARSSGVLWCVVLNPAILLDGPIWGQVDLLPWIPLSLGVLAHARGQHIRGPAWFALALAVKFQSIVFAPLFAALWLRGVWENRKALWGVLSAPAVMIFAFLPFILAGRAWDAAGDAYWDNVGMYPYATYNAANLWYLLTPPEAMRNAPIPGWEAWSWMTPSHLGLVLFGAFSLFAFAIALRKKTNVWAVGVLSMFAFFAFSSDMHERYLFAAVPFAAMWAATESRGRIWLVISTFAVALNIAFLLFSKSPYEWNLLSWLIVLSIPWITMHVLGLRMPMFLWKMGGKHPLMHTLLAASIPVLFFAWLSVQERSGELLELKKGESQPMVEWKPLSSAQEWDQPKFNKFIWENEFAFANRLAEKGIKVHARSELVYDLPEGEFLIKGFCGPEKEAGDAAELRFEIAMNDVPLWSSAVMKQKDPAASVEVLVQGPGRLQLRVDPMGANHGDHALWGELVIERTK